MRAGLLAAIAVMLGACVTPSSVFTCDMTQQCTVGGTCEPVGYCSFPDGTCPSGRRFSDTAGDGLANTCVGGGGTIDADPNAPDADPDAPDAANPGCEDPFVTSAHGCHAFLTSTAATWDVARATCTGLGSDMTIVQSLPESEYIAAMALGGSTTARAWIGLDHRSGDWRWVDGSPLTFENWNTGEPAAGEECAVIRPGAGAFWAGRGCEEPFIVVCEK